MLLHELTARHVCALGNGRDAAFVSVGPLSDRCQAEPPGRRVNCILALSDECRPRATHKLLQLLAYPVGQAGAMAAMRPARGSARCSVHYAWVVVTVVFATLVI